MARGQVEGLVGTRHRVRDDAERVETLRASRFSIHKNRRRHNTRGATQRADPR